MDDSRRIDSHGVIHRRQNLGWVNWIFGGGRAGFVRLAMHIAAFDTGPTDDASVAIRPVISTIQRSIGVAGRRNPFLRAATEFAS